MEIPCQNLPGNDNLQIEVKSDFSRDNNKRLKLTKKSKIIIILSVVLLVIVSISIILCIIFVPTTINLNKLREYIKDFKKVQKDNQLIPEIEEISQNGTSTTILPGTDIVLNNNTEYSYYFTVEEGNQFKVLQITDVHIEGGKFSEVYDQPALRAVAAMITVEKPDLVIFTGDVSSSWECLDNSIGPTIITELMQKLGIYWAIVFGNHESESDMKYNRKEIAQMLENSAYIKNKNNYCLFISGPENIYGYGNYVINIKNKKGKIVKSLILLDSNSDGKVNYDRIHDDQIDWYQSTVIKLSSYNQKISDLKGLENNEQVVSSELFFHIPIIQILTLVNNLLESKGQKTNDTERLFGELNEKPCPPEGYTDEENMKFFNTLLDLNSTEVLYFGHDHCNNAKIMYKGIIFSYSMSIDYWVYSNINHRGRQRGSTLITYKMNGDSIDRNLSNQWYYQDKYKVVEGIPYDREELSEEELTKKACSYYPDFLSS